MDFPEIFKGTPTPAKWAALGEYLRSSVTTGGPGLRVRRVGNKTVITTKRQTYGNVTAGVLPPFHVRLFSGNQNPINYWMTVTPGRVTDHIPYEGADALAIWIPFNLKYREDEEDLEAEPPIIAGDLRRFPIIPGQCLAVKVMVTKEGAIGPDPDAAEPVPTEEAVEIVVVDVSETSSHYVPVVADGEGGVGVYFYHLAELKEPEVVNDPPEMELILSGSHIEHWRERPAMTSTGSGQEVLKEYDVDTDTYKFRTIVGGLDLGSGGSGDGQISVSESEDEVLIRGNNIDGSLTITVDGDSPQTLEWEDGLILTEDSLSIDIPAPFEFPGGGTGSLTITTDGGSPQTLAWANGLVTTNEILGADIPVIPDIPPPLPAGDTNKLMIHNGTAWVALDAPPATGTHVLGCVDNVVQWLATEECP